MLNLIFGFSYILFALNSNMSPYNTNKHVEDIPSIIMMYNMSKYDNPKLRYHHFSRMAPYHSRISAV